MSPTVSDGHKTFHFVMDERCNEIDNPTPVSVNNALDILRHRIILAQTCTHDLLHQIYVRNVPFGTLKYPAVKQKVSLVMPQRKQRGVLPSQNTVEDSAPTILIICNQSFARDQIGKSGQSSDTRPRSPTKFILRCSISVSSIINPLYSLALRLTGRTLFPVP
jgi:hypothetical protein